MELTVTPSGGVWNKDNVLLFSKPPNDDEKPKHNDEEYDVP